MRDEVRGPFCCANADGHPRCGAPLNVRFRSHVARRLWATAVYPFRFFVTAGGLMSYSGVLSLRLGQFGLNHASSLGQEFYFPFRGSDDLLRERCEQWLNPLVSVDRKHTSNSA